MNHGKSDANVGLFTGIACQLGWNFDIGRVFTAIACKMICTCLWPIHVECMYLSVSQASWMLYICLCPRHVECLCTFLCTRHVHCYVCTCLCPRLVQWYVQFKSNLTLVSKANIIWYWTIPSILYYSATSAKS